MKTLDSMCKFYDKLSNFGKLLVFVGLLLVVIVLLKPLMPKGKSVEGMENQNKFLFKEGSAVYDDFYANIYDHLVFSSLKNDYEVGEIINNTTPSEASIIADIGCGTGHHAGALADKHLKVIGVDISPSMIEIAKKNAPNVEFKVGNALESTLFNMNSLTHILCMYFTIYYFEDKRRFFDNAMDWLMPGGYLIVHMVDRETFDPILPPGNPLYIVSPQKYAKERITKTKVTFNDFVYNANFNLDKGANIATFDEKFKFNDGHVRKQQQKLYMEDTSAIVNTAQQCGFILHAKVDLVKCAYENQYLYIFVKPT
jgi:ubiquinone/menaquinone biosynthesis C-methylase UbiE